MSYLETLPVPSCMRCLRPRGSPICGKARSGPLCLAIADLTGPGLTCPLKDKPGAALLMPAFSKGLSALTKNCYLQMIYATTHCLLRNIRTAWQKVRFIRKGSPSVSGAAFKHWMKPVIGCGWKLSAILRIGWRDLQRSMAICRKPLH